MSEEGRKAPRRRAGAKKSATGKASKTDEGSEEVQETEVVLGPVPPPKVLSRHEGEMHRRDARGFSFGELEAAGVGLVFARDHGVMVDVRRRSVLDENVTALKGWYVPPSKKPKAEAEEAAEEEKPRKKRAARPKRAAKAKEE